MAALPEALQRLNTPSPVINIAIYANDVALWATGPTSSYSNITELMTIATPPFLPQCPLWELHGCTSTWNFNYMVPKIHEAKLLIHQAITQNHPDPQVADGRPPPRRLRTTPASHRLCLYCICHPSN
ncbi:hypothetical protein HPB47_028424 [Ixodes persulcatus]|uniref:Uncharacterized protein n=1 Tax=Ixodes persulcatus TaxID=34615 RepID=A0AC60PT74_IXOPE|nr:hypothetical protein HPB47_028424 [Ixodes persulcatus]